MEAHVPFEVEIMDVERDVKTQTERDVTDVEKDVGTAANEKDGLKDVSFGILVPFFFFFFLLSSLKLSDTRVYAP